jgi:predicted ribosome quality control (RQC) complex YloA/Tae2 family protein
VTLQWAGLVLAVLTFGTIGLGHVAVRRLNYRYGTKPAPFFLVLGLGFLALSLLVKDNLALRDLEQVETDLKLAASRPEIDEVWAALIEAGHLRAKKGKGRRAARSQPISVTSPDGYTILVDRNSRQNDEVTFRRAKSDDWWFHARGVPGAHVIVRSQGGPLPPDTLRRAAQLAAYYSQKRTEADVLVDYTQRRHVRRIPRAAPGLVTYSQEKTVRVVPTGPDR